LQAREVEHYGHGVCLFVVTDIHPARWVVRFAHSFTDRVGEEALPRAEHVQLLALAHCSVAEHVVKEMIKGRIVVE
jgi:hypothetical protein